MCKELERGAKRANPNVDANVHAVVKETSVPLEMIGAMVKQKEETKDSMANAHGIISVSLAVSCWSRYRHYGGFSTLVYNTEMAGEIIGGV